MNTNRKSPKRKLKILISIAVLAVIAVTGFIFKQQILAEYEYYFKLKHFNRGDKVYLLKEAIEQKGTYDSFFRLVRPLTEQDIEEDLTIDKAEKVSRINQIDPSLKPRFIKSDLKFEIDTLHKYKTASVGTFLYRKVLNIQDYQTKKCFFINVYALKIDYPGYFEELFDEDDKYDLPEGYTWADKTMYYPPALLTNVEYSGFKK